MSIRLLRFAIGRALIAAGIRALPPGRVRDEIYNILAVWGAQVSASISAPTTTTRRPA